VAIETPAAATTGGVKGRRKSKKDRFREAMARSQGEADPSEPSGNAG
jgi:hypothetical protein